MIKRTILFFLLVLLYPASTYAKRYLGARFVFESNVDSRVVENMRKKADLFYDALITNYSLSGWLSPLTVYYSKNESQTNQLLSKYGFIYLKGNSYYKTGSASVYIHQADKNKEPCGPGMLYYGITRHFIAENFKNAPEWFKEGLSRLFEEQAGIIDGTLIISDPEPGTNFALKEKLDKGSRPNVKILFTWTTPDKIQGYDYGYHLAQTFFYWLHTRNQLGAYLKNVQKNISKSGYDIAILESTLSMDFGKINIELLDFLNKVCYAEAYLTQAVDTNDPTQKKEALVKALEHKQDYNKARLELVKYFHDVSEMQHCKDHLKKMLSSPVSPEHISAAVLLGNVFYIEKDYVKACEYYTKAWNYATNYDYRYRIAYRLANSYNHLKKSDSASKWYKTFLADKWNADDMKLCSDYAQRYIDYAKKVKQAERANRIRSSPNRNP